MTTCKPSTRDVAAAKAGDVSVHLRDYINYLRSLGRSEKHVCQMLQCAGQTLYLAGVHSIAEFDPVAVQVAVWELHLGGLSLATCNRRIRAIKSFYGWCWRRGRIASDPSGMITSYNSATDKRHERRAFSSDEIERLVGSARQSRRVVQTLNGESRAMLYELAVNTGLRASSLLKLTPSHFSIDDDVMYMDRRAGEQKNRRDSILPIPPATATRLQLHTSGLMPNDPIWPVGEHFKTSVIIRHDCRVAGIQYKDDAGRFADFHSLRHTYGTNLGRAGVGLRTIQFCMGHQTPAMSMRYQHVELSDAVKAIHAMSLYTSHSAPSRTRTGNPLIKSQVTVVDRDVGDVGGLGGDLKPVVDSALSVVRAAIARGDLDAAEVAQLIGGAA